jgi:hypothetical protein
MIHMRAHRSALQGLALAAGLLGVCSAPMAKAASVPEQGTYLASFCTLAPNQPVRCVPASAQVGAMGMKVRVPKGAYEFTFGPRQVEVEAREAGRPQAHFLADFRWQDGRTLHFSETQPTQWEVRLGERKNP